ncbi:L,D-transpeptidase family protein [Enhydrobacter aerosaccus]|nr:L,D-transpeptidase family protein [Enhydrobacter aerosaccus]
MPAVDRPAGGRLFRAFLSLIVGSVAALGAACTGTDAPGPVVTPPAQAVPPPSTGEAERSVYGQAIPRHGKFVVVNIPSFELVALQDGAPVLQSRVIVGRPESPTPELLSSIYAIKFNPSWTPTPWMIRNEAAHYMPPGPQNPLGRILFEMDNDQLVYLHDTNQRDLFNRQNRAFSHGCVRVEKARQLAAWALGVSEKDIEQMIGHGGTYAVPLPEPIPVSLVYNTRFPNENGQSVLYPDVYHSHAAEQWAASPHAARQVASVARSEDVEPSHRGCEAAAAR